MISRPTERDIAVVKQRGVRDIRRVIVPVPVPSALDFEAGCGVSVTYFTTYHAFRQRAQLAPGETVLVLGAASGVGEHPAFGRGRTSFNRYLADPANQPNPCVAPVAQGPVRAMV